MTILILILLIIIVFLVVVITTKKECDKDSIIKTLVRQASRWSTASLQDENTMIAVLHANYGAGYLWALQDTFTPEEIEATGVIDNFSEFRDTIVEIQDNATRRMAELCPGYAPPQNILTKIGGEGV